MRDNPDNEKDPPGEGDRDRPSLRQRLSAATGDREAEAKALRARTSDEHVTERDAKIAEQRAHGDTGADEPVPDHALATPSDAEKVSEERQRP